MHVFKITLQRDPNKLRLVSAATHLDIITFIRANNLREATTIAQAWASEHNFVDCIVEKSTVFEFRRDMQLFLSDL